MKFGLNSLFVSTALLSGCVSSNEGAANAKAIANLTERVVDLEARNRELEKARGENKVSNAIVEAELDQIKWSVKNLINRQDSEDLARNKKKCVSHLDEYKKILVKLNKSLKAAKPDKLKLCGEDRLSIMISDAVKENCEQYVKKCSSSDKVSEDCTSVTNLLKGLDETRNSLDKLDKKFNCKKLVEIVLVPKK